MRNILDADSAESNPDSDNMSNDDLQNLSDENLLYWVRELAAFRREKPHRFEQHAPLEEEYQNARAEVRKRGLDGE